MTVRRQPHCTATTLTAHQGITCRTRRRWHGLLGRNAIRSSGGYGQQELHGSSVTQRVLREPYHDHHHPPLLRAESANVRLVRRLWARRDSGHAARIPATASGCGITSGADVGTDPWVDFGTRRVGTRRRHVAVHRTTTTCVRATSSDLVHSSTANTDSCGFVVNVPYFFVCAFTCSDPSSSLSCADSYPGSLERHGVHGRFA